MKAKAFYVCLLIFSVLFIASSCAMVPSSSIDNGIKKSAQDKNQYRALTLDNKMEVLLVSSEDPTAAAVLDVRVGSASNPVEFPGLAHFLEHLLFLGTKKYPEPQSYQQYISTNGGSYNASTGSMHTNYYFAINSNKLEPALDRLAQFFIAPLFGRKYIDRELAIIESEYQRNKNNESRAIYSVNRESYNPEHPSSRFSIGNQEVLLKHGKEALYQELLKFYKEQYSANRMKLVVHGDQSLDELEAMVRKYFSPIINNDAHKIKFNEPLYTSASLPMLLKIKPKSEIYRLDYVFPIVKQEGSEYVKSASFISHLLGHEADGSLLAYLRNKGWAKGLSSGSFRIADSYFIGIQVDMTPEGNKKIQEINQAVFSYIRLIANDGLETWRYGELQRMAKIDFDFQEPLTSLQLSKSVARSMHHFPTKDVLSAANLYSGWDKEKAQKIINSLTPDNVRISHIAPDVYVDRKAKWFDIDYSLSGFDVSSLSALGKNDQLHLPKRNNFIPKALESKVQNKFPYKVEHERVKVWHSPKKARQRASLILGVFTERHRKHPKVRVLKKIYLHALQQRLANQVYMASLAGLNFQLYDHLSGITLRVTGYSDKLPLFFDTIISQIGQWQINPTEFERYRLEILRSINNQVNHSPSQRVGSRIASYLIPQISRRETQISILENLRYRDWQDLASSMKYEPKELVMLGFGEISKGQVMQAVERAAEIFPGETIHLELPKVMALNDEPVYITEPATAGQSTDVLELYFQIPSTGYKKQVSALMLANYLQSPFFYELRTERKLGYQADVFPMTILEQPGIGLIVESDKVSSAELSKHFQSFIERQKKEVASLDQETFAQLRQGIITSLQRLDKGIFAESLRVWRDLTRGNTQFNTRELLVKAASQYTIEDFHTAFKNYIINNNRRLWALSQVKESEQSIAAFGSNVDQMND